MKKGIYAILTVLFAAVMIFTSCNTGSSPSSSVKQPTIKLSPTKVEFATVSEDYTTVPAEKTITVTNTGVVETGELTVELSGTGKDSFTLSKTKLDSIKKKDDTATFTVVPKPDLLKAEYTATVTVKNNNIKTNNTVTVKFTVIEAGSTIPTYGIGVAPAEITFATVSTGYTAPPTAQMVTVTNPPDNEETGELTVELSGTNAGSFTLSKDKLDSIAAGESDTFTVVPKTGLGAGSYTATVTVSNDNITSNNTIAVRFAVNAPNYGITLSRTTLSFASVAAGYTSAPTAESITVTNPSGNEATGALTVALTGDKKDSFTLSKTTLNIAAGATDSFTVQPKPLLTAGTHNATVTISNANIAVASTTSIDVSFTVQGYGITVAPLVVTFPTEAEGYTAAPAEQTITVTNPQGNAATGTLNLVLKGTDAAANFELSKTTLATIASSGTDTFTVRPKTGRLQGLKTATIEVTNANITAGVDNTVTVNFTVNPGNHGITTSPTSVTFPAATAGYGLQTPETITVSNAADKPATGPLTVVLEGVHPGNFELSKTTLPSIAADGQDTFTIVPKTGLSAGTYTATIKVSGDENDISATIGISFIVNKPVPTVSDFTITGAGTYTYDGGAKRLTIKRTSDNSDEGIVITYGSSGSPPINEGTYNVTFSATATDEWAAVSGLSAGTIIIIRKPITTGGINVYPETIAAVVYTSKPHTFTFTVDDNGVLLTLDTDYEVAYVNNIEPGTATITISGKGNYSGSRSILFTIEQKDVAGAIIVYYWVDEHDKLISSASPTVSAGGTVKITASASGYTVLQWSVDGKILNHSEDEYDFSSWDTGPHNVSIVVSKGGKVYSTTIVVTVN